ncbi:hypothetical protein BH10PSE16_BH10PSE16_23310 [soil metagenome]
MSEARAIAVRAEDAKKRKGEIAHFFYHLAAVYGLEIDEEHQIATNMGGTRNVMEFAKTIEAGHFHHVSSMAAAGLYEGVFREDLFEEAENYEHLYFRTKHESEKIVRTECKLPWTVFRPAMVVGHGLTGEMDKIDGPYYFFKLIQRIRKLLIGEHGGVDFLINNAGRSIRRAIEGRYDRFHDYACTMSLNYFELPARDHGTAVRPDGQRRRSSDQYQFHWRADQCIALFSLCRQ